jgi:hypothetical protein
MTIMKTTTRSLLFVLFTLALIWACSDETNQVTNEIALSKSSIDPVPSLSSSISYQGMIPYILQLDGLPFEEPTCADVAEAFGVLGGFEFSSSLNYNSETGTFDGDWPEGLTVNVSPEQWRDNLGTYVEWSFTLPEGYCSLVNMAVIVQGCDPVESNVYFYPNGDITTDSELASPNGGYSVPCVLENLTFCYNLEPCEDKCYGGGETAFGGNSAGAGNAWWFYYDASVGGLQTIWAGQHMEAGTVEYDGDNIIINLDGWGLDDAPEAVKIQGYDELPAKRPAAGHFDYKGMDLTVEVDLYPYYVIHLDLLQEVECEEE